MSLVEQRASARVVVWDMEMSEGATVGESSTGSEEMLDVSGSGYIHGTR